MTDGSATLLGLVLLLVAALGMVASGEHALPETPSPDFAAYPP